MISQSYCILDRAVSQYSPPTSDTILVVSRNPGRSIEKKEKNMGCKEISISMFFKALNAPHLFTLIDFRWLFLSLNDLCYRFSFVTLRKNLHKVPWTNFLLRTHWIALFISPNRSLLSKKNRCNRLAIQWQSVLIAIIVFSANNYYANAMYSFFTYA